MRKNISINLLVLLFLSVMVSCKAKKEVVKETVKNSPVKANYNKTEKLAAINKSQTDFNTLAIRSRANLSINNDVNDVSMNIRIRKNEAIWVSVTAIAGIEVARALITPDSIKIMNRLEDTYLKKPFSYIYEFASDQINFGTLQSILVGNTIKEFSDTSYLNVNGRESKLSGLIRSLTFSMQLNDHNKVLQTSLRDARAGQTLQIGYTDFALFSSQEIPQTVNLKSLAMRKNIQLDMKYARVEVNPIFDIPFNVPKRFSVID